LPFNLTGGDTVTIVALYPNTMQGSIKLYIQEYVDESVASQNVTGGTSADAAADLIVGVNKMYTENISSGKDGKYAYYKLTAESDGVYTLTTSSNNDKMNLIYYNATTGNANLLVSGTAIYTANSEIVSASNATRSGDNAPYTYSFKLMQNDYIVIYYTATSNNANMTVTRRDLTDEEKNANLEVNKNTLSLDENTLELTATTNYSFTPTEDGDYTFSVSSSSSSDYIYMFLLDADGEMTSSYAGYDNSDGNVPLTLTGLTANTEVKFSIMVAEKEGATYTVTITKA
jgi:hypothetical protein